MTNNNPYSDILLKHYRKPAEKGKVRKATHTETGYNHSCGDKVELWVEIKNGVIAKVGQEATGCMLNKASASILAASIKGKSLDETRNILGLAQWIIRKPEEPIQIPGDLSDLAALKEAGKYPTRSKCLSLAWDTLEKITGTF